MTDSPADLHAEHNQPASHPPWTQEFGVRAVLARRGHCRRFGSATPPSREHPGSYRAARRELPPAPLLRSTCVPLPPLAAPPCVQGRLPGPTRAHARRGHCQRFGCATHQSREHPGSYRAARRELPPAPLFRSTCVPLPPLAAPPCARTPTRAYPCACRAVLERSNSAVGRGAAAVGASVKRQSETHSWLLRHFGTAAAPAMQHPNQQTASRAPACPQ